MCYVVAGMGETRKMRLTNIRGGRRYGQREEGKRGAKEEVKEKQEGDTPCDL